MTEARGFRRFCGGPVKSLLFVTVVDFDALPPVADSFPDVEEISFGMTDLSDEEFVSLKLPDVLREHGAAFLWSVVFTIATIRDSDDCAD